MYTQNSRLFELYQNPVGKDMLDTLFRTLGKPALVKNPLVRRLRVKTLQKLAREAAGAIDVLLHLANSHSELPPPSPAQISRAWWKEAVVYQIYPRSFQDSNGDGIGDLAGIRARIPYLKELGVTAVWLSPIYDSPNDDMGYDIRDYQKIMAEFGTMADFDALLEELHANGIRLVLDMVLNHTSDEHRWFQAALADPQSGEHGYYIWADGKDGGPPNNWVSFFSGPAWNDYPQTGQWALHLFSKKQMDLNWENDALRGEISQMVRWWRDKGVDGFRMDVINLISKENLEDGNETVGQLVGFRGIEHYLFGPRLNEYLRELRQNGFGGAFVVGEPAGLGMEMSKLLSAEGRGELDMMFSFDHLDNPGHSRFAPYEYDMRYWKPFFLDWQQNYGNNCWPSLLFENHDNPRMVSKIDPGGNHRVRISKLLAVLQFTLKGTPFLYQGQELGMTNAPFRSAEEYRDVDAINRYHELAAQGKTPAQALAQTSFGTRDHARTPMQWDDTANGGFTKGQPWIGMNENYKEINAQGEMADADSAFSFYKKMIALRMENPALVYGDFRPVDARGKDTFCYFRGGEGAAFYVEVNLTGEEQRRPRRVDGYSLVAGNYGNTAGKLRAYEANVFLARDGGI